MIIKKILSLLFIAFLVLFFSITANSSVWKVMKNGHHLFLGGTIHLLTQADYPLPEAFEKAYDNSVKLVLETDIDKANTPEFQQALMQKNIYPGEQNIKQFLRPKTFQKLEKHLASRGLSIDGFLKLKSRILSITITIIELQRLGLTGTGVDKFFNLKALNNKKEIMYLEVERIVNGK